MAVTKSGRTVVIYDGRADLDDLPGAIDLLIRFSDDSGESWSEQKIFRKSEGFHGYGDASIIFDPYFGDQGRIIVLYQATKMAGFFESHKGSDLDDPMVSHVEVGISDDNGESWNFHTITQQIKSDDVFGIFASSGMGSCIQHGEFKGRLLQTFLLRTDEELIAAIGFSDDHGETWKLGARIPNGNESKAIGLTNGDVLIHSRAKNYRIKSISKDGGATLHSSGPDLSLPDPSDNGSLTLLSDGSIICTHNYDKNLRRKTVIRRSFDKGKTWTSAALLVTGSSAYSTSCELPNGKIGVFLERNGYNELVFYAIAKEELTLNRLYLSEYLTAALRYIKPSRKDLDIQEAVEVEVADLSKFGLHQGKEIGEPIASKGTVKLFTKNEYEMALGKPTPGLKAGDELRFSLSFVNSGAFELHHFKLESNFAGILHEEKIVEPGEKFSILDVRRVITELDLNSDYIKVIFTWNASNAKGASNIQRFSCSTGEEI
jgi:sialidase-1